MLGWTRILSWTIGFFVLGAMRIAAAETFSFIAIGDMPYGNPAKAYPQYAALIEEINRHQPSLVFHVGDTKKGSRECTDQVLAEQLAFMNSIDSAVIYTPGDNEWTGLSSSKRREVE